MAPLPHHYAPAHRGPSRSVVAFGSGGDKTYEDLAAIAGQLSHALRARIECEGGARVAERRVEPRDVLVLCDDRFHFAAALLATWHLGLTAALPHTRASDGIKLIHRTSTLSVVDRDGPVMENESIDVRTLSRAAAPALDFASFTVAADLELAKIYTSGTTGAPIPFTKTARQLLGEADVLATAFEIRATDRIVPTVAAQHIYGLLFGILVPLTRGASFARETPLLPDAILEYARRHQPSVLVSVPPQWQSLRAVNCGPLPALRLGTSSGAPLALATGKALRQLLSIPIIEVFGSSETGGIATKRADSAEPFHALPGVEVANDAEGRLIVRSPFLKRPEEPLRSADSIEMVGANLFVHCGRSDRVVKIGAKRVTLAEIERHALAFAGVREAHAVAVDVGGVRGTEVWLAVAGACVDDTQALRRALRSTLDLVFVPRRLLVVPELPRGPAGKVADGAVRLLFARRGGNLRKAPEHKTTQAIGPVDTPAFTGHFPANPVYPGAALLCDLILPQVSATYGDLGMLCSVARLKFHRPVGPCAELSLVLSRERHSNAGAPVTDDREGTPMHQKVAFTLSSAVDTGSPSESNLRLHASGVLHFRPRS